VISVSDALDALFALVDPLPIEDVDLIDAAGRVLGAKVTATRAQPPFAASAMDGYAVADTAEPGKTFTVIGEAAAGHRFDGTIGPGQAVRIFTGAPLPNGGTRVIIQEDVTRDGDVITLGDRLDTGTHIRPAGGDFNLGDSREAPRLLRPADLALLASMNCARVPVTRRPTIALIATGDELVMPGEDPRPDQIIASNSFGLKALFEAAGAKVRLLPAAKDTESSLATALELAQGSDLIITIGGASVGDHDIVGKVAEDQGLARSFYKIAMRPGKPLMAGRMGQSVLVGLPGNPVSAMVCGEIFIKPMLDKMLGFPAVARARQQARLVKPLPANGPREHYMRARHDAAHGQIQAFERQDSALLHVLAEATALVVRPPNDPARAAGDSVDYIVL
jgi:molybdopterin molybdotransferase